MLHPGGRHPLRLQTRLEPPAHLLARLLVREFERRPDGAFADQAARVIDLRVLAVCVPDASLRPMALLPR
ncbi:MAG: hypothetical protein ACKV19_29690 [Verrucomicrobiales bacterium]